jgi:hypothetical protein
MPRKVMIQIDVETDEIRVLGNPGNGPDRDADGPFTDNDKQNQTSGRTHYWSKDLTIEKIDGSICYWVNVGGKWYRVCY